MTQINNYAINNYTVILPTNYNRTNDDIIQG